MTELREASGLFLVKTKSIRRMKGVLVLKIWVVLVLLLKTGLEAVYRPPGVSTALP